MLVLPGYGYEALPAVQGADGNCVFGIRQSDMMCLYWSVQPLICIRVPQGPRTQIAGF